MKFIVGLGNPGKKYDGTRHNVGFRVIDGFSSVSGVELCHEKHLSVFGKGKIDSERFLIVKPLMYMNRTGKAISSFIRYYSFEPQDLLVVYDDMNLNLGRIRIRAEGSAGGHKGVESIIWSLRSEKFPRIRVGIGRADTSSDTEFVLGKFRPSEEPAIEKAIGTCVSAIEIVIRQGLDTAMNMFN